MLQRRLSVVHLFGLAIFPLSGWGFAGGTGTQQDPFQISTVQHLAAIKANLAAHYVLINDLDFSAQASPWDPIGERLTNAFRGSFDGADHTIANFQMSASPAAKHTSLFHFANNAVFKNVRLTGVQLISNRQSSNAAGLVGYAAGTKFDNCHVSGSVENTQQADAYGTSWVGLLVGGDNGSSYTRCSTEGSASGPVYVGGLIGGMYSDSVARYCYSTASVRSTDDGRAGGLVGEVYRSHVQDSYATGSVTGPQSTGGLIGLLRESWTVARCYAVGAVSGTGTATSIGGLIGQTSPTAAPNIVTDSYWSSETSGQQTSADGTRVDSAQALRTRSTFADWNFHLDWALREFSGFPYLQVNAPATATPLLDWLEYHGLTAAQASEDGDGDGLLPMVEYFVGSTPVSPNALEQKLAVGGNIALSFRSNRAFSPSGVRLSVIAASGLEEGLSWTEVAVPFSVAVSGPAAYTWTCAMPSPAMSTPAQYFRLRFTEL